MVLRGNVSESWTAMAWDDTIPVEVFFTRFLREGLYVRKSI
jgi:hypothetical protein